MVIQKMNNVLVKHGKICFAIFTAVIIVSFVWFFTPGVDGSLLFGGHGGANSKYGAVLGQDISRADVRDAQETVSLIRAVSMGVSPGRVQLIEENDGFQAAVMIKAADVLNVRAGDQEVAEVIRTMPAFQKDGAFSQELYAKYKDMCLTPMGLGFSDIEEAIRTMIRIQKVPMLTVHNVILPDSEFEAELTALLETVSFRMIMFDSTSFEDQVKLGEHEAEEFYTANTKLFMSEPESDGLLAVAPYTITKNTVTDEQVKDYYEANKANYKKTDDTYMPLDSVTASIRKQLEETIETASAAAKIRAFNKAFRDAIRADKDAYLADPQKLFISEAEKAGLKVQKLQNITAKTGADDALNINAELVEAVTILKNVNSYSNIVNGEKAASMFLLTARRPAVVQAFDVVKDKAVEYLKSKRAQAMAEEAANALALKAAESKNLPGEIEAIVKDLKGTIRDESKQTRYDVESNPYLPASNAILTTGVGKLSTVDKQYGFPIFVFITGRTPATAADKDAKRETLRAELLYRKQEISSRGLQSWVFSTATVVKENVQNGSK